MTTFFIDLWHDLREKRLWPVAVGLLAAIVAVPAILFKPASDAAPPVPVAPNTNSADALPVVAVESGPSVGSNLEAFDEKNPFKPMKDLAKEPTGDGTSAGGSDDSAGGSSGGSGSTGSGSGDTGGLGSSGGTTGDTTGGTTPDTGGSTGNSNGDSGAPAREWFHYVANFSFGAPGDEKTFEHVGSFQLLPDEKTPVVVFLGVSGDHKSAMFFISDPAFTAGGEGDCNAKGDACQFVTLKLSDNSDEETFTSSDGDISYNLKLLDIKRESLGTGSSPEDVPDPKTEKGIAATGAGVATTAGTAQSVIPPMIAAGGALALERQP